MTEEEWLACNDPYTTFETIYRKKRPSRARIGQFFSETAIAWNKDAFEIFAEKKKTAEADALASQIRCFFGNPFRPITLDPSWLTSTVTTLARTMYDTRDFTAMPILADALMDAGCEDEAILTHCRGPGPHVRGCFLIDLLTGRE